MKVTKTTSGKCTVKFLRSYIDTHGVPESICLDQFSGFKGKTLKKILFGTQYRAKILSGGGPQRLWFGRTYNPNYTKKTGGDDARRKQ